MKKWLLIFVAILGFSSLAGAQRFSIGGGISGTAGSDIVSSLVFNVNLGIDEIVNLGPIGVDARVDLEGKILGNSFSLGLGLAALGTFQLQNIVIYAGPRVFIPLVPAVGSFAVGALAGVRYSIAAGLSAYGELSLLFSNPISWRLGFGVRYSL
jgi:hypothetical protein